MIDKNKELYDYAGFWIRVLATTIDTALVLLVIYPVLYGIYGPDILDSDAAVSKVVDVGLNYLFPAVATVTFWICRSSTPGKLILGIKILDATTGHPLKPLQAIRRYISYYLAMIPLMAGIFWVVYDSKKQGWHDKLANTVVVRYKKRTESVRLGD